MKKMFVDEEQMFNEATPPNKKQMIDDALDALREYLEKKYPARVVPRPELSDATGGIIHSRTQANRDSKGCGIPERFKIGKVIYYPIPGVLEQARRLMA